MNKNTNVVCSVIYPGVEKYLKSFIKSILGQSFNSFDILIINDKCDSSIRDIFPDNVIWIDIDNDMSPVQVRQLLFEYCLKNCYEVAVFIDSDDLIPNDYIKILVNEIESLDFVFSEMIPFFKEGDYNNYPLLKNYVSLRPVEIEDLMSRNIIGLGNSAIKVKWLRGIELPHDIIAADWYLFSCCILNGALGRFVSTTHLYYRQTGANTVGSIHPLDNKRLMTGINAKQTHYKHMKTFCVNLKCDLAEEYDTELKKINELKVNLNDKTILNRYILIVNKNLSDIYNGWWSEIIDLEKLGKYE